MADNGNGSSQRPAVGDLGYVETGTSRELGIVVGHNDDGSVNVHVFAPSHPSINKTGWVPFSTDESGGIPPVPEPEAPEPAPAPERW